MRVRTVYRRFPRARWVLLSLVSACLFLLATAGFMQCRRASQAPRVLHWDFSQDNRLSNISQPLGWSFNTSSIDGPARLVLDLEDGRRGEIDFWLLQVGRDPDRKNRVRSLVIFLEPQNQVDAAKSAIDLAQKWKIANTRPLEDFRNRPDDWRSGGTVRAFTAEVDHRGKFIDSQSARVFIEIRGIPHPGEEKPYNVVLLIPLKDGGSAPATGALDE